MRGVGLSAVPSDAREPLAVLPAGIVPASRVPSAAPAYLARRSIILEGDDLGLLHAFNEGIRAAYRDGVLTSTCLRANGFAYRHAIETVLPDCPGIGVGVHLCLNEAAPVAPRARVSQLLGRDGDLRPGFAWLIGVARRDKGIEQIEIELRAQIERVLADGVSIDHLNAHQHVHMIPRIFRLTCRLAAEYRIPAVRIARELAYLHGGLRGRTQPYLNTNIVKRGLLNRFSRRNERYAIRHGLQTTDYFLGVGYTANMNLGTICAGLLRVPYGSVELLAHPAIGPDARDRDCTIASLHRYVAARQRADELAALQSPELRSWLQRENWSLLTYAGLVEEERVHMPTHETPSVDPQARETCERLHTPGPIWVSQAQADSRAFAQLAISITQPGQRVLDLGTGTGVLGIAMAQSGRVVVASDVSGAAVRTARRNATRCGVSMTCVQSDLLESVPGRFDLIAFNPPYNFRPDTFTMNVAKNLLRRIPLIRRRSGLAMPRGVLRFHQQLVERLIRQAPEHLNLGGAILIHAYESEAAALAKVLPRGAHVQLLHHDALVNQTVGLLIRLP